MQQGDKSQLSIANYILRLGAKGGQMEARRMQQEDKSQLRIASHILRQSWNKLSRHHCMHASLCTLHENIAGGFFGPCDPIAKHDACK